MNNINIIWNNIEEKLTVLSSQMLITKKELKVKIYKKLENESKIKILGQKLKPEEIIFEYNLLNHLCLIVDTIFRRYYYFETNNGCNT